MNEQQLQQEIDNYVRAINDRWRYIIELLHKQDYGHAKDELQKMECETRNLFLTTSVREMKDD